MLYDVYAGLSDEYREYRIIQPGNLNFREAQNDAERRTAASLVKNLSKEARTLFIIGGVIIGLGVLVVVFRQLGGLALVPFGGLIIGAGFIKKSQASGADLVATGTLLKKDRATSGSVSRNTRMTHIWLVIEVDDMDKTLCVVHAEPEDYDDARVGDKILVINELATSTAKKIM